MKNALEKRFASPRAQWTALVAVFAILWFAQLNIRHLIPSDEGRYAEMAREMLASGDWLAPRYNGYLYFEKPPLQTWINAASFAWLGIGDWQARLYTALCSFSGVLLIGLTGARLFNPQAGLHAALALGSSPYWNLLGHFNVLDMGLAFWMQMCLCTFLLAQRPDARPAARRGWMWLCWASMALAVLTKGLVGVLLPGAALALYTLIARDWALWRRLYLVSGVLIFSAIAAPWFVLIQSRYPAFFEFFFIVQHFRRYLTPEQNRPGAFYYFVPVIIAGFLPWVSILWRSIRRALEMPRQPNGFKPALLLVIWIAFIFIFFSLSYSKLISYILPVAPALALLLGFNLPCITSVQWRRHLIGQAALIALGCIGALYLIRFGNHTRTPNTLYRAYQVWAYISLAVAAFNVALSAWISRSGEPRAMKRSLVLYAFGWLLATMIAGNAHEIFGRASAGIALIQPVRAELAQLPPNAPFYSVNMLDHTMPFYLRRMMIMVQHPDELRFGIEQEPHQWIPTIEAWIERWKNGRDALALMSPALYLELVARSVPMRVVARDMRRVVVTKPQSGPD
ncbi:Dolichyl-phosphate-mannose-protein mannosyltransferase family protein [Candidatus Glomeribacter gigasporarum BEG34]|uniref:Dolichyl-phosphate-mannose-protein mannosyltransferase family protein n=1 Tax=Candidatus Glomeribacter gigasporarum BEG34 TaxID=1070319 RepID=G2J7N1_9BURK|nr:glycosyltransferase family 39 protein [Candidatus Glomeribacter gigasporarum]CCD28776.1 Dolichyl-phosphate-mannose-protein mannosyltransferase family protein [Candidatus Glomeribacter gigasporarum BEG34]